MNNALTKADLVSRLREKQPSLNGVVALQLVDAFFEEVIVALEEGGFVKITGLGSFRLRSKKARPGRNPKTGVNTIISSRNVVCFQPSQKLKNEIKKC